MLGESELVPSVRAPSCHRGSRNVSSPWHRLRAGHLSTVCGQFLKSHSLSMNLCRWILKTFPSWTWSGLARQPSPWSAASSSSGLRTRPHLPGIKTIFLDNFLFLFCSLSAELAAQQERKTVKEYLANMKVSTILHIVDSTSFMMWCYHLISWYLLYPMIV